MACAKESVYDRFEIGVTMALWLAKLLGAVVAGIGFSAGRYAAAAAIGYLTWLGTDYIRLFFYWVTDSNPVDGLGVEWLHMPEWVEEWDDGLCALNAWLPIAETWAFFKVYWSMVCGCFALMGIEKMSRFIKPS